MTLLAGTNYDPAASVSKATTAATVMAAIDTTNLRLNFIAPENGIVLVRMRTCVHGAITYPQILLGVLDGASVVGRCAPFGQLKTTAVATAQLTQEAQFLVTGLTSGQAYTWDAAFGVETVVASTGMKYGGPNNTTGDDAFGGFVYEIYSTEGLVAGKFYDPAVAVNKSTSLLAMTAIDTTNLRHVFTVPPSGIVLVRMRASSLNVTGAYSNIMLGVLESTTVKGRAYGLGGWLGTPVTNVRLCHDSQFIVSGLTPGASLTWDAAYNVETTGGGVMTYGGPNDTTASNAFGGFAFEIWDANSLSPPFGITTPGRSPRSPVIPVY